MKDFTFYTRDDIKKTHVKKWQEFFLSVAKNYEKMFRIIIKQNKK